MHAAFEGLLSGQYRLEERVLLNVEVVRNGSVIAQYLALNDAVINKGALARIIDLEVSVNSQPVLFTRADGLIISTPTGSTAYSLAAGGPILYPTLDAFIIAPICPHALANRPLVIPDRDAVGVCLRHGADVMLTVDGQVGMPLQQQDCLNRPQSPIDAETGAAVSAARFLSCCAKNCDGDRPDLRFEIRRVSANRFRFLKKIDS